MEQLLLLNTGMEHLRLYQTGQEICKPSHHFGPAVRQHYLLHYVFSGGGRFEMCGNTYYLHAGQAFLIVPNVITYYAADNHAPWHYAWLEFGGAQADGFLRRCGLGMKQPIYTTMQIDAVTMAFRQFLEFAKDGEVEDYRTAGGALLLFDAMLRYNSLPEPSPQQTKGYVQQAVDFIRYNYHRPISVAELCTIVGVEHSYLCRLFKAQTGKSPQGYIVDYKLAHARTLLQTQHLSVAQAARSVGYEDQAAFSKLYKKRYGVSPNRDLKKF